MPFKSKRQVRYFAAAEARGELPKGTFARWERHTPSIKKLPEQVKKAYEVGMYMAFKTAEETPAPKSTGKETRLKRDHNRFDFYSVKRNFERAGTQKKEVGVHVPLKEDGEEKKDMGTSKTAYAHGILTALRTVGLLKQADEDTATRDAPAHADNPAEALAAILQQGNPNIERPGPDNKTKKERKDDSLNNDQNWNKEIAGHGGETLERLAPGFNMPNINTVP